MGVPLPARVRLATIAAVGVQSFVRSRRPWPALRFVSYGHPVGFVSRSGYHESGAIGFVSHGSGWCRSRPVGFVSHSVHHERGAVGFVSHGRSGGGGPLGFEWYTRLGQAWIGCMSQDSDRQESHGLG